MKTEGASERLSCALAGLARSTCRYCCKPRDDGAVRERLRELASSRPCFGTPRLTFFLRQEFGPINHKRVERLYAEEGLKLPRRSKKRRRGTGRAASLEEPTRPNERWSMDFVSDSLYDGRRYRTLNIVDDFTRECVHIEVDTGISGQRVARVLNFLLEKRSPPGTIVMDNGPEFTSRAMLAWFHFSGVKPHFIDPGKPVQNCYVESFNGKFRNECLNQNWFISVEEAKLKIEGWRVEFNTWRPHSSLRNQTPESFRLAFEKQLSYDNPNRELSLTLV